jgi:hypothetical protein
MESILLLNFTALFSVELTLEGRSIVVGMPVNTFRVSIQDQLGEDRMILGRISINQGIRSSRIHE